VVAAAVCAGLAVGLGEFKVPTQSVDKSDAPVTAAFSYCQWGGGSNCVVDGDTFWIGGEKVRIAGIDAPVALRLRSKARQCRDRAAA
jgi:micrococcal nuclease